MNREDRRAKHNYSGAQIEKMIEHNVNQGFQEGKMAAIGKMTEIYSVAAAYAVLSHTSFSKNEAKELVDSILATFTKFNKGEVDYDDAKKLVEDELGIVFKMLPDDIQQQVAQNQP